MINGCLVTDMQHHFIPEAALRLLRKTPEHDFTSGLRRYPKAYATMADIRTHLDYMDKAGIDVAVLSTGAFAPSGHEFCRACNEQYAAVVKQYPGRFKGMIQIHPLEEPSKNRDEIKRAVDLGLWGLSLASSYWENTIDSPAMYPTFEAAIEYSMPVFIHPSVRINQWGGEKYNMYTTVSREYDVAKAVVEMVWGVLPRFSGLKVIFAHLGGGMPALKGRLLTWYQPEGFTVPEEDRNQGLSVHRAKELGLVDEFEGRFERVLFDAAGYGGWPPVMAAAFRALGADHLCLGTDYPYEMNKAPHAKRFIEDMAGLELPAEDKKKFFCENVERFMARS